MPGLAVHVCVNGTAGILFRARRYLWLFILGGVLPDALTRVPGIVLPSAYWLVVPLHTPLVLLLVCYVVVFALPAPQRGLSFAWLYGGVVMHLLPDALQKHLGSGYPWLFPFSYSSYSGGLFWPDEAVFALPVVAIIWAVVALGEKVIAARAHHD